MSRRWVANASPLILLGKVGQTRLLRDLTDELLIPEAVAREVGVKGDGERLLQELLSYPDRKPREQDRCSERCRGLGPGTRRIGSPRPGDGDTLVGLLIEHGIGVEKRKIELWSLDPEAFVGGDEA